jgi:hypothetical protein
MTVEHRQRRSDLSLISGDQSVTEGNAALLPRCSWTATLQAGQTATINSRGQPIFTTTSADYASFGGGGDYGDHRAQAI